MSHQDDIASYSGGSETRSDPDLLTQILSTLENIKTPSAFAYSATDSSLPNPVLYVPPHGALGLPLSTDDAKKIISQASQSPFGKEEETIVDTTVRKSWELNPNQFSLKNPAWNKTIETILNTVTTELGLENAKGKVSAELYKLLLYEPGAFFKPHKDSEKAPGMFATLVVCLPSPHEGGKLIMRHDREKQEFETADSSSFGFSYAAWFSDITHEVLPVISGYRLMLTYNLIRRTDLKIPSYDLARGLVNQLMMLLEQYNLRLLEGDDKLPPFLLHKLEHKYTQANLKLSALKPPDLAQVQTLAQLSTKLKFDIFLAILELEVRRDDEDEDAEDIDSSQGLKNMIELDGKLVVQSFDLPDGALLDPTPQDEDDADESEHEGYTGNAGCPVTYWYRDAVVVLVPPAKRLDFVFEFKSGGTVIGPPFCKLMQELSRDPAGKPMLEKLCQRTLKQGYLSGSIPSYFQEAAATALDLGRMDLFDVACKRTGDKIMLLNARKLGYWTAKNGVATMCDRLMKGVQITSSVAQKVEFLKLVAEGFEAVQEPGSAERESLKQWSDEAIFTLLAHCKALTKADGMSLGQLCKTMDWSLFESKAKPVILKAVTMTKITFVNQLMSTLQHELNEEQQSFIEMVLHNIWNEFVFDASQDKSNLVKKDELNENDLLHIVENSITILSSECVETTIIPAMLTAVPNTGKECPKELFVSLVRMILTNKLVGFRLPTNDAVPPSSYKRLVQALLTKFLIESVGLEPQAPINWSLPARSCNCSDCRVVNNFLRDPYKQSLDFPCSKARRYHLHQNFTNCSRSTYDVETLRGYNPNIWRITKHQRGFQTTKSEWVKNTKNATQTLLLLQNDEPVNGRLMAYLQPYYVVIMNANVKELPDLRFLVTMPQLTENIENAASAHNQPTIQVGLKREASSIDDGLAKRTRS